eukprot:GHVU01226278.1.p1 GENE.GHVU01226278.1~~GHVU01226278.1.p1  ORF type:complete len:174 (+),score=20.86 GHVU01226278.1:487-1008(+)
MPLVFQTSAAETPSKTKPSLLNRLRTLVGIKGKKEKNHQDTSDAKPDEANNEELLLQGTPAVNEPPVRSETQTKTVNAYKTSHTIIVHFLRGRDGSPTHITIDPGTIVENNNFPLYTWKKKLLKTDDGVIIIWMHPQSEKWTGMRTKQSLPLPVPVETKSIEVLVLHEDGKPN